MVYLKMNFPEMKHIRLLAGLLFILLSACGTGSQSTPIAPAPVETAAPLATLPPEAASPTAAPATQAAAPSSTTTVQPDSPTPEPATPAQTSTPAGGATAPVTSSNASALPDPGAYTWTTVASGLENPVGLANAGDGSGRLFILEQQGRIRILQDGALLPAPFLDITGRVGSSGSEQGLLGLAFHPRYSENGFFYVNYTDLNGNTVIARYQVASQDPNQADPGSESVLLHVDQPFPNHNGGVLRFGPDSYLYAGLGDGGGAGDPFGNAQSLDTLLGKILRFDVDGGEPYAIPPDNPFASGGGKAEIWAFGLRNPWRFAFDSATGDLYIGDVGQNQWEEIDFLPADSPGGSNFGWDYFEGTHPYDGTPPEGFNPMAPVAEYDHSQGCSVTGGEVYRGSQLPEWQGVYLYADYCSGNVWGLLQKDQGGWDNALLYNNVGRISSFGLDEAGEVYVTDISGSVYLLAKK